jgi:toxin-antitoxin system PIN domain toxin
VFVVDTNVLVYAADADSQFHTACRHVIDHARGRAAAWYLTWGICYEFMRVVTHPRVFRRPWSAAQAWKFVYALLSSPSLGMLVPTERHAAVISEVLSEMPDLAGNLLHDAHTAVLMREHGIRTIYTRDTDYHRFAFVSPVDPARV